MRTTTAEVPPSPASPARPRAEVLRRADGIELIGEFEDSGFKEPPLLARRSDGQVVQLTELLYAVAAAADGRRDVEDIAAVVSERCDKPVTGDNVRFLVDDKLRPLGVLALPDGSTPELKKREPVMALRHRKPLLPERAVNAGARLFTWLHRPFVSTAIVVALIVFDVWLFGIHGVAGGLRSVIYNPALLLAVLGSVIVATAFHEFGHASACRYGGARPGVMGVGLYLVWPAFYCDVTDAYRLNRKGRLRTDLGGIYFNGIFALLAGAAFFATGQEAALLAAFLQHAIACQQLLPLLRFDGYYVMTDLTGVPDILSRIGPIFRSLVRGRKREPKVAELRPWVRVVVTAYLVTLIPTLAFLFGWMTMGFPRVLATVHDSLGLQVDRIRDAAGLAEAAVGGFNALALVMPVGAMSLSLARVTRMAGRWLVRWSSGSLPRKVVAAVLAGSLVGAVGYVWWPNGDYEPIRPGERGTIGEAVDALDDVPGGRPSFTPERELTYGPVATVRQQEAAWRNGTGAATTQAGRALLGSVAPQRGARAPAGGPEGGAGSVEQSPDLGGDGLPWPVGSGSGGSDYASGQSSSTQTAPSGTTTQPGGTTTTQPAAGTTTTETAPTTTTEPAPGTTTESTPTDTAATTTTEPAPTTTDGTSTTTTETAPTTTETAPTTIDAAPATTETAPTTTETAPTTTETVPTTTP